MTTSFKFSPPEGIPRMLKRGEDQTLDVTWYENNTPHLGTVTAATFTLKQGSTVLIDAAAATTLGGTTSASYDLLSATTSGLSFSDTMLEIWTITAGTTTVTARRSGHLVHSILYPLIQDSDLISRHARIEDIRPPSLTSFSSYINTAWSVIQRILLSKGRRQSLILDSFALVDLHTFKSLELVFRDAITFVGDGRYHDLADMYARKFNEQWDEIQFRYDRNEDNSLQDGELEAATPSIWLGELPPTWGRASDV